MKHRERLEACLAGDQPDRTPVALWRHFPVDDMRGETMAAAHLNFQKTYDFDLVKVTPSSGYFLYDWGVKAEWRGNPEGTRAYTHRVIERAEDWGKLEMLDPRKGHLAEQIIGLEKIVQALGPDTPVLMTIFNPISNAKKLVGDEDVLAHLRQEPEALHRGLEIIAESTRAFIAEIKKVGVAGIFYAVQHAQKSLLSEEEYKTFGRAYDLPILEDCGDLFLNMLHLHGDGVMFDLVVDYPVQAINWHDLETEPDLAGGKARFGGAVCGGLRQWE
ncbi:MAG: uroporphyrinogen decarboxylase, partial [Chloroflexi bacterium]|nr:uroporphyrinogen decarboxylase [Chloroflexota bacterium]